MAVSTIDPNGLNIGQIGGTRNKIINGGMVIDQRNAGAAVTINSGASFTYSIDRWYGYGQTSDGVFTLQQDTSVPSGQGFTKSLKATVTTADASIGATQLYQLGQRIEGYNVADLGLGTAGAASITLSFWVRSSLTGTFGGALQNGGQNRSYPFSYTISSADTWEKKTITLLGDTSGTWLTTNGTGVEVIWGLGIGSTYLGTAGSWSGSFLAGVTGQTQVIATNGATFYITGVQLEAGDVSTPFEHRSYGQELALCQRYFFKTYAQNAAPGTANAGGMVGRYIDGTQSYASLDCRFPVSMRAAPTVTLYAPANGQSGVIQTDGPNYRSAIVASSGEQGAWAYINNISIAASVGTQAHFVAQSEL